MTSTLTSPVVLASNAADSAAVDAVVQHHAELVASLTARSGALLAAAGSTDPSAASSHRADLVRWCWTELLPHAEAEEGVLYELARALPEGRLLIEGMVAEHRVLTGLVDEVAASEYAIQAAAKGYALQVLFAIHAQKENDLILPLLAAEPSVSLAQALDRMHERLAEAKAAQGMGGCGGGGCACGGHDGAESGSAGGGCACGGHDGHGSDAAGAASGGCACGGHDEHGHDEHGHDEHGHDEHGHDGHGHDAAGVAAANPAPGACACGGHDETDARPVLDARAVPHNIRHATVFGALDAVGPGSGLELWAPHDPMPLLAQIEQRNPGAFEVTYLERGPETWRLALDRRLQPA